MCVNHMCKPELRLVRRFLELAIESHFGCKGLFVYESHFGWRTEWICMYERVILVGGLNVDG